jgi:hypothetical protein
MSEMRKRVVFLTEKVKKKTEKKLEIERILIETRKKLEDQNVALAQISDENQTLLKYKKTAIKQEEVVEQLENLLQKNMMKQKGMKETLTAAQVEVKKKIKFRQIYLFSVQIATLRRKLEKKETFIKAAITGDQGDPEYQN